MRNSVAEKTGLPGFGVSLAGLSSSAAAEAGSGTLRRATIARASASVDGSGTVGPEAITRRVVEGHVGDRERQHRGRRRDRREPPALDAGQVLPDGVDLADIGAGAQQRAGDALLLLERELARRRDPVRRAAARQQHEDEVVGRRLAGERERPLGGLDALAVGHRMAGLDDRDQPRRLAIAVARHGEPGQPPGGKAVPLAIEALRRRRHAGAGLAGREHDQPAAGRRRRQVRHDAGARMRRRDRRLEEAAERVALAPGVAHPGTTPLRGRAT